MKSPSNSVTEPAPPRKPIWRRWRWWLASAVCIALTPAVYVACRVAYWDYDVSRERAMIKARGEPTTLAEWQALCTPPAVDKDATRLWLRGARPIFELQQRPKRGELSPVIDRGSRLPNPGEPWEDVALSKQFLDLIPTALADLHAAADLGGEADYPIVFNDTILDSAQTSALWRGAQALAVEADVRAHDGDMRGAADSLHTGLLLALSLGSQPTVTTAQRSSFATIVSQLNVIGAVNLPADDLKRLAGDLSKFDFANSMKLAALGERVLAEYAIERQDNPYPRFTRLFYARDEAAHLRIMSRFIEICELPWNASYAAEMSDRQDAAVEANEPHPLWTGLLTPSLGAVYAFTEQAETQRRLATIAIAVARYEQRHGKPPRTLADLAPEFLPEVPTVAKTSNPFTYRTSGDGYVLFSQDHAQRSDEDYFDPETPTLPTLTFRWPPLLVEPNVSTADE